LPWFFWCGGFVVFAGIFAKKAFLLWCFCGEFVVECVVNVVQKRGVFVG
jgi:hypothetical protein